ncbi:MAG: hypothetical protein KC435_05195 [Thermomicrobiales bacterium]|nr:hypothetical protein [Thermomicrobiales bacterium]
MTDHDEYLDELLYHADRIHTHTPGAATPPSQTWQRVLATILPEANHQGEPEMTTFATLSSPVVARPKPTGFIRFANTAASVVVLVALAFGGWLAAMHLRPAGEDDPRYAALGLLQTDAGNGVCDVESLTVDEAVQIVQNPLVYLYGSEEAVQAAGLDGEVDLQNFVGAQPNDWDTLMSLASYTSIPLSDDEFFAARAFSTEYQECILTGTRGQIWAMMDPILVQYQIITRIPLLQSPDETEAAIADLLDTPYATPTTYATVSRIWQPNPDRELMTRVDYGLTWSSNSSYIVPMQTLDVDGNVLASYDIFGNRLTDMAVDDTDPFNMVVVHSNINGAWYYVGAFASSPYADVTEN